MKPEKHDYKHAKQIVKSIEQIDRHLQNILENEKKHNHYIKQAYESLKKETITQVLKNIDIEEINKDKLGIRVSALKKAGIYNLYQLNNMSFDRLISIKNIGEQTADKIKGEMNLIYTKVVTSAKVKIDPENKSEYASTILEELYVVINNKKAIELCERVSLLMHNEMTHNIKGAKRSASWLRWLFSSKQKKEESLENLDRLENILNSGLKADYEYVVSEISRIYSEKSNRCWSDFQSNASIYYSLLESIVGTKLDREKTTGGMSDDLIESIEKYPLNLELMKSTLRSYQIFGVKYILHQKDTLLGDEMGLGKTIQSIAAMCELKSKGKNHFLVICPASVLINWSREVEKHSELKSIRIYGKDRDSELDQWIKNGGVAVSTYETISKVDIPTNYQIDMIVIDEAHYVKNPEANRSKSVVRLLKHSNVKLFMTGTPIENNIDEMCTLVECLQPNIAKEIQSIKQLSSAPQFRKKVAPVYLRRVRDDVLTELPDLLEKEEWNVFTHDEMEVYKSTLMSGNFMAVRKVSWNISNVTNSSKAIRLLEICDEAKRNNRKIIVFSYFRDVIQSVESLLEGRILESITGSVSSKRRQEIIDEFETAPAGTVLVSQVIAGGVGLNIQTASVVVFCEPQIKPSIENQAISRVYRMGQTRNVTVYRLLMENSIDEKIMELLKGKQLIFDNFADQSYIGEASLSSDFEQKIIREEKLRLGIG